MKKKTLILPILTSFLVVSPFLTSCKSEQKQAKPKKEKVEVKQKIQDTFFGMKLGKTKLSEGEKIINSYDLHYNDMEGFGESALVVCEPVTFGNITWGNTQFVFYRNILYQVYFSTSTEIVPMTKKEIRESYTSLISNLKNKYHKYKCFKDTAFNGALQYHFKAEDSNGIYYVEATYNKIDGVTLGYCIHGNKLDKVIPSDL